MFKDLREIPLEELRVSESMDHWANKVMSVFDDSINGIENVDGTRELLHGVAKRHRCIEGFESDFFWVRVP